MTTDNPSSFHVQPSQQSNTRMSRVSVTDSCHLFQLLILIQPLGGLDHELSSNAHLPDIHSDHSTGPYSAMNPVNPLPPTRYASSTLYDDPRYPATVGIHLQTSCPLC